MSDLERQKIQCSLASALSIIVLLTETVALAATSYRAYHEYTSWDVLKALRFHNKRSLLAILLRQESYRASSKPKFAGLDIPMEDVGRLKQSVRRPDNSIYAPITAPTPG
ncbi:hypothetical protein M422DRAFT_42237 [Sphaerobolus stellatus SS14]|nr:hypothetical protein M422DRAFT_42237 [Sphaerobolus stellatus SS14]